ncbi:APC family permease [Botrimarina mediterranea]|uniref:Putative amino acid permease YhdG n=1 Tax=Botrimarina mediterranea TaxID=2528022 RepID=A0A518K6S8_9BACT|nr:APC family permease [Botrimarina mediterranea]QDV73477.1 putative amino acid permease YhdG [Botrimarina mediterranea]
MSDPPSPDSALRRQVGVAGATLMGLGSILGTGVFVSIALGAAATGPSVVLAIGVAAVVAACNGLSSAQLAANHPVSGGTYEYGYRWLSPTLGFVAGWLFLCAKSASAATAALGFAGYALGLTAMPTNVPVSVVAVAVVVLLTSLVLSGLRRANWANVVLVSLTIGALAVFCIAGQPNALRSGGEHLTPLFQPAEADVAPFAGFLEACALMFVAFTGYGRIATLGEEVVEPRRNIPRAIVTTLVVSALLYAAVGFVAIAAVGAEALAAGVNEKPAPLETAARAFAGPAVANVVAVGAVAAMGGVLLNLILGLSRVVLAMARRGDLPRVLARVNGEAASPTAAVMTTGVVIAGLAALGSVKAAWSFSAFTVLGYYALTNLAALRLRPDERLYPVWTAWAGLASCLFLAFWVEPRVWLAGVGLIALGLVGRWIASRRPPR